MENLNNAHKTSENAEKELRISDVINSVSENIASNIYEIKSNAIGKIEDEIYKVVGNKMDYDKRRLIAAIIFKECILMNMSISDDYVNIVGTIHSIFQKHC